MSRADLILVVALILVAVIGDARGADPAWSAGALVMAAVILRTAR